MWHFNRDGTFSVQSGYLVESKNSIKSLASKPSSSFVPHQKKWSSIWQLPVPLKIQHLWWRVLNNAMATGENLFF